MTNTYKFTPEEKAIIMRRFAEVQAAASFIAELHGIVPPFQIAADYSGLEPVRLVGVQGQEPLTVKRSPEDDWSKVDEILDGK